MFEERNVWANQLMTKFKEQYCKLHEQGKLSGNTGLRFGGTNCISVETQPMQPFIAKQPVRCSICRSIVVIFRPYFIWKRKIFKSNCFFHKICQAPNLYPS